jgi:hypothetical protein
MKFTYLLISACFLISCDSSVDHDQIVQNDSDLDIWFRVKSLYPYDSLLLPIREETIIFVPHGLGSARQYENCDYFYFRYYRSSCKGLYALAGAGRY